MDTDSGFEIKFAYVATVPPCSGLEEQDIIIESKLFDMDNDGFNYFLTIFDESIDSCKIRIIFTSDGENQENEIRTKLLNIVNSVDVTEKKMIADNLAKQLSLVTDDRNGDGLFAIIEGKKLQTTRLVLIRLRSDEVVVKRKNGSAFTIDLVKDAYSKKSNYYKAVVYEDIVSDRSFWNGFTIDKQIGKSKIEGIAYYWIKDFLLSKFAITSIQGTQTLAKMIKNIFPKLETIEEKEQIIGATTGLKYRQEALSIEDFSKTFLDRALSDKFLSEYENHGDLLKSKFLIDKGTIDSELKNEIITLDNGIIVAAPTYAPKTLIEQNDLEDGRTQLSVKGVIVNKTIKNLKV